jgi:hypothetical protein
MPSRRLSVAAIIACAAAATPLAAADTPRNVTLDHARQALVSPESFASLRIGDDVMLELPIDRATSVLLDLKRFSPLSEDARIVNIDANGQSREIDLSSSVFLRGHVAGDPEQIAFIAITDSATNGFVVADGRSFVLSTGRDNAALTIEPSENLNIAAPGQTCAVDSQNPYLNRLLNRTDLIPQGESRPQGSPPARRATIAFETDYEFTQLFGGNETASSNYVATLIGAIATIYQRDVNVDLEVGFLRTYSANNDLYSGSDIYEYLYDIQDLFFSGELSAVERDMGHGLSGRSLGGGLAWVGSTCDPGYEYGVSANLNGFFPTPLDNNDANWDLIVVAHEMGHNFGSGHTHDSYEPTIDDCGNGDCSPSDGTIMSYCHLCPGGISNMDLRFHPRVQERILDYLDNYAPCDLTIDVGSDCPADLTMDGTLDFFDISELLTEQIDYNDDSTFDFFDISAFLQDLSEGCP